MWLQQDAGNSVVLVSPRKKVSPRALPIRGARIPNKNGPLSGRGFTTFAYSIEGQSDPYELSERARRPGSCRDSKPTGMEPLSPRPVFKHAALPQAPGQAGSFQRFRYSIDPFERRDEAKQADAMQGASKTIAGSFLAGGNARNEKRSLSRRQPELREQLKRSLRNDWPSFIGIQLDDRGHLILHFDAERLDVARRADLHTYMNRLLQTHPASIEFALQKDPTRWGVLESALQPRPPADAAAAQSEPRGERLIYTFRPPWVPNDLLLTHRLGPPRPSQLAQLAMASMPQSGQSHSDDSSPR
jgi:hypothetical protein